MDTLSRPSRLAVAAGGCCTHRCESQREKERKKKCLVTDYPTDAEIFAAEGFQVIYCGGYSGGF